MDKKVTSKFRALSQWVIVLSLLAVFIYDAYAFYRGGQESTISSVIITDWIYNYPYAVFLFGTLCGHLFWPLSKRKFEGRG